MNIVCTLFEGDYYLGLAAFANSLYAQGYKGELYAGYKGDLPGWTNHATMNAALNWPDAKTLHVAPDFSIHFLPIKTTYHLTNYKPDFMLQLIDQSSTSIESIFYFDPDIIVTAPWTFLQEWITYGVALCEDVNSPLAKNHPRRAAWRDVFKRSNIELQFKENIYANGGFVGLTIKDISFISTWKNLQEVMGIYIGGLERSAFKKSAQLAKNISGPFAPFGKTDQDALNASVEAWSGTVSFYGQEAMGFKSGAALMPHALGQPKPWNKNPLKSACSGNSLRSVDKLYWQYANGVIKSQNNNTIRLNSILQKIAIIINRFYARA